MKLPQGGDNELWREGIDWITIKVIAKVRFGSFSHISLYKSVVLKCCPNVLHHVAPQRWYQCCSQSLMVLIDFKGYCQGQKCPIWAFVIYLGQYLKKRCMLWPMFVWSTYKVIYDLSIDLVTFDLGLPLNVKSRSHTFQVVVSHKWCIIWSKFVWNTYIKSHLAF